MFLSSTGSRWTTNTPPTTTNMSIKYEAKDVNSNPSGQKGDTVDASEIRLTTPVG